MMTMMAINDNDDDDQPEQEWRARSVCEPGPSLPARVKFKKIFKSCAIDSFHLQESVAGSFASLGLGHVLRHKAKTSSSFRHLVSF